MAAVKRVGPSGAVKLNAGSNVGLREGMILLVYRGTRAPKCLGSVRIVKVTATEAVAKPTEKLEHELEIGDWLLHGLASH
jgi:hypothetical protein